ncbi:E3 ubiquitin-protein ligase UPL2 [Platanthera zijinensis]|uniref:E3 ubiquitin-protein ligase UPL2 n=1 Tax=Platanthera zijinensis TaxID=2320716 RepID=A0AAP0FTI9_9ASPA
MHSFAKSFTQHKCEPSNQHKKKESQIETTSTSNNSQVISQLTKKVSSSGQRPTKTAISLYTDRGLINEDQHTIVESVVEHVSTDVEVDHVPTDPTDFEHATNSGLNVSKKRTRGPTIGLEWSKRRQNNLERVDVQLPAELRRLVGYRAQELITKSGRYVRQNAPLNVEKWSEIPTDIIDKIVNIINAEFNLPKESHVHGDLISSLHRHYNVWRFRLHANYYLKWNTDAQRRANGPKDIDPAQWNWIINYWGSARFKRISEINKQNRSQQKMKSHVGSKSIARTVYEMRISPNEQDELPLYIRLWEKTHKGKHNEWQDETVKETYNMLLDLHDTQMREKGEDKLTLEEAYTTVLGHRSGVPPLVSRRLLETLTFLARNHHYVAKLLLHYEVSNCGVSEMDTSNQGRGKAVIMEEDKPKDMIGKGDFSIVVLLKR